MTKYPYALPYILTAILPDSSSLKELHVLYTFFSTPRKFIYYVTMIKITVVTPSPAINIRHSLMHGFLGDTFASSSVEAGSDEQADNH
ncbi:hypothetical protein [Alteromonas gilva]|uniref:Uncharacterized protein n=1 Tax=Alteromonas gilva TaxID=2987522 RepID=A0ABT5KXZ0_9ALTE|nr:hypothetical protein [Alteromonas gilva]MDC8829502.1 hypothetical protein [Alteromonas gilva]